MLIACKLVSSCVIWIQLIQSTV
uniref:Uncharacterized protein n=1 Tax=Arundo donax TaxID=35708 RepID=A0A0A8YSW1_ARUDO